MGGVKNEGRHRSFGLCNKLRDELAGGLTFPPLTGWMVGWLVLKNKRTAFLCSRCVLFYKRKLMIFHELSDNKACIMSEKRK